MSRGQLVGGRSGIVDDVSGSGECEVTCKVESASGKTVMCNGLFIFKGAPVIGVELDDEAEFHLEYGRPEGDLLLLNYEGRVRKVNAWITTANGPQVVLEATYQVSKEVKDGVAIPVAGPELRYMP